MKPRINLTFRVVKHEIVEFKGIRLQLDKDKTAEDLWIEAYYDLPNGNCADERFVVLEGGQPTYTLINENTRNFSAKRY